LAPAAAGLHPEDRGGDALRAFGGGLAEQELGDLGRGLGGAEVELVPVVLAKGLWVDADDAGNVCLRDAIGSKRLDLATTTFVGSVGPAAHVSGAPGCVR